MPPSDVSGRFVPSILDRLTNPVREGDPPGCSLPEMLNSIRDDLEMLLNTHQSLSGIEASLQRVRQSIAGYGLPDLTEASANTPQQREEIAQLIADVIARYEPRLRDIQVRLHDPVASDSRSIRCRIEGRFAMDPAPAVAFDSRLEVMTGHHEIQRVDA